jgi:hypothetical protein
MYIGKIQKVRLVSDVPQIHELTISTGVIGAGGTGHHPSGKTVELLVANLDRADEQVGKRARLFTDDFGIHVLRTLETQLACAVVHSRQEVAKTVDRQALSSAWTATSDAQARMQREAKLVGDTRSITVEAGPDGFPRLMRDGVQL